MTKRALATGLTAATLTMTVAGCAALNAAVTQPGASMSTASSAAAAPTGKPAAYRVNPRTALLQLDALAVKGRAPKTGYSREQFGNYRNDTDRSGCDQRNDALNRDLTKITTKADTHGCKVLTGVLHDPYTGKVINFQFGQSTSAQIQIDHVVSESDAWQTGAQQLTPEQRNQFSSDLTNLLAVDGHTNESKGDGDAATWLPPNKAFRCAYVARQITVKTKWHLWVTPAEKQAMTTVLNKCGGDPS